MKLSALRLGIAAAALISAGHASARELTPTEVQAYVLDQAEPGLLAQALAKKLATMPANDPRRADPRVVALRDTLASAPALSRAIATLPGVVAAPAAVALVAAPAPLKVVLAAEKAAPPPASAYAVVLGTFDDAALAGSVWRELAAADPIAVKGLSPHLLTAKGQVTLLAGPLADRDVAAGRCTAFAALGVQCAPGAFAGKPLPAGA